MLKCYLKKLSSKPKAKRAPAKEVPQEKPKEEPKPKPKPRGKKTTLPQETSNVVDFN